MIENYEIRNVNGEDVLYLYFDFSYEFGNFDINKFKKDIKNNIDEFIKKNKIAFTGTMVSIIVGGISLGSIYLDKPKEIEKPITQNIQIEEKLEENNEKIEEELVNSDEPITEENNEEVGEENVESNKVEETDIIQNTRSKKDTNSENIETKEIKQEEVKEEVIDNNIYVSVRRQSGVVNIELEEYVVGVVGAEMPASFDIEALKAQSVLARTYALKAISKGQTLTDNNSTQNYKDINQLKSMWGSSFNTYYNKIRSATESTKGTYLTYNGDYIEAVYHSTSNGRTEDSINVWGNGFPYLVSVSSEYDNINPSFYKETEISYSELTNKLGMDINIDTDFNIISYTVGNRVSKVEIYGKIYTGVELRNILGLRSTDFELEKTSSGIIFKTKGYGHGVGMSQYGANGMAKNGYNYINILNHYYPGTTISNL